jgi:hypothetical protein
MAKKEKKVEEEKPVLNRYEQFLVDRGLKYINSIVNKATAKELESIAAGYMKALKVFVEQTVRRIAFRNGWNWIPKNFKTRDNNGGKKNARSKSSRA